MMKMIIERVHLKDFLSHSDTEIHFSAGVTAIIGPNGAGKTSVIDGIIFALFNERVRGDRITDIIKRGRDLARVELVFSESGNTYTIMRTRSHRTGEAEIYEGDTLIARTHKEVTEAVFRILGMDRETLMNSFFIRQGEITGLIEASPADRKRLISRLIGIDKLESAWNKMREVVDYFEDKAKEYDIKKAVMEEKKRILKELNAEISAIKRDKEAKTEKLNDIMAEFESVKRELSHLKKVRARYQRLSEDVLRLGERVSALNEKMARVERDLMDAEHASEEMRALEPLILRMENLERYVKMITEIERLKREYGGMKEERAEIRRLIDDMMRNRHDHIRYEEISSKLERMKEEEKNIKEHERRFMELKSRDDALNMEIERMKMEIEHIRSRALKFLRDASVAAKENRMNELDARIHSIDRVLRELIDEKGRIRGRMKEITKNMRIIDEASECPVCRRPLHAEHREKVRKAFEKELQTLSDELRRIERDIEEKHGEMESLRHEKDEIGMIDVARLEMLMRSMKDKESEKERIERTEAELSEILQKLERLREDIRRLEQEKRKYERGYQEYIAAEKALGGRNLDSIDDKMRKLNEEIENYEAEVSLTVEKLGYLPEDAEEELKVMREKKERYAVLKEKVSSIERLSAEIEILRGELERVREEKSEKEREIEMTGFSAERYEECERRYHEIAKEVERLRTTIRNMEERENQLRSRLKSEEAEFDNLRSELTSLSRLKDFVLALKDIREVFSKDKAQRLLRQRISPLISEYMRDFIERFNMDISDVEIDEDLEMRVIKRGGVISARAMSGGEKVAVAIALRLAIARALSSRMSSIVMDEPTTHLDEERRRELIEILKYFFKGARSILPQMIIVTHHREIEDAADNIILIENTDGNSQVKNL
ncbi:MAG: AAA family ATPase [Canidatus Methanoxibalbensis ujae]|nr:AAA family ATPase [Candidatus Methanoxibalbensis ujae]